jgi:hypothetical protein
MGLPGEGLGIEKYTACGWRVRSEQSLHLNYLVSNDSDARIVKNLAAMELQESTIGTSNRVRHVFVQ